MARSNPPIRGWWLRWRRWVYLVGGIALAVSGTFVAAQYDIGRNLELDLKGARVTGEAAPISGGVFRLSYIHPSGAIYARSYKGPLEADGVRPSVVFIVYEPQDPRRFQPAGLSYLPGTSALILFALGMAGVLRARRLFLTRMQEVK